MIASSLHGSDLSVFAGGLLLFFCLIVLTIVGGVGYRKLADRIARWRDPRPGYVHPHTEPGRVTDAAIYDWLAEEREPHS